jgi:hypothetical protein
MKNVKISEGFEVFMAKTILEPLNGGVLDEFQAVGGIHLGS